MTARLRSRRRPRRSLAAMPSPWPWPSARPSRPPRPANFRKDPDHAPHLLR
jgi:hypothetical protein